MKKKILGAAILLCMLGGCSSGPTSYETGKENLEQQDYTQAIKNFQDAVEKEDHTAEAWRGIGLHGRSRAYTIRPRKHAI